MAGIDYSLASIEVREKFSFTKAIIEEIYQKLLETKNVQGSVLISTCNRTEIYISTYDEENINPFEILCDILQYNYNDYKELYKIKIGDDVMQHLCELSCGVKSQIWGEDQIISQVKNSIVCAREHGALDSTLEVIFRKAVTCGKKVKTTLKMTSTENSIAYKALNIIKADTAIKNILVIGNGEIGRLTATVLAENGYNPTMTLRQYTNGTNIIPEGTKTVNYSDRYTQLEESDAVVSATLSPHYTLEIDKITEITQCPKLFIDLAVPRDIDPRIKNLQGVKFYDVDSICAQEIAENHTKQLAEINVIIEKYILEYKKWCEYKQSILVG